MANVLISYDVSNKHPQVKAALTNAPYNYMDTAKIANQNINLPNTTLWKLNGTAAQGRTDMEAVARANGVRLERAISVEFINAAGVAGDPHTR